VPELAADRIDRLSRAAEPARRLARGETTLTRLTFGRLLRSPLRSLAVLTGIAAGGAIVFNMMLLQPERHRAPIFAGNPVVHPTPQPSAAPLPPPRPVDLARDAEAQRRAELLRDLQIELGRRGFFIGEPDPAATARTAQAIRDFQTAAKLPVTGQPGEALLAEVITSKLRARDQILTLLRASAGPLERPDTVAAVQRALTKLNYGPLKDDGQFGAGTRAALDRFEKDRKLAPRGDSPARVLRELTQASGVAID
jgi:peptidoglycan hydrolase-like protein with peptidoglycan-binding domain